MGVWQKWDDYFVRGWVSSVTGTNISFDRSIGVKHILIDLCVSRSPMSEEVQLRQGSDCEQHHASKDWANDFGNISVL
jgi:hypothetical protein